MSLLPEKPRLLRRDGLHLFGIRYWAPALAQDVGRVDGKLAVRYDPRDLSHVFVRRPNGHFVEARYRELAHPAISLWERDAAVAILYGYILQAMGVSFAPRATVLEFELQALRNLKRMEVKLLMLDEVHNLLAGSACRSALPLGPITGQGAMSR